MAQPVQLQFRETNAELPDTYVLPADMDLSEVVVQAKIDGSGAAATFIPCLAILSQDGKLMQRVRIDQEFAVGDTGDCAWAQFLRRAATATPAGATLDAAYIVRTTNLTVNNATPTVVTAFDTGGATGSLSTDLANGVINITTTGIYIVHAYATYTATFAVGGTTIDIYGIDQTMIPFVEVGITTTGYQPTIDTLGVSSLFVVTAVPGPDNEFGMRLSQNSGVSRTADTMQVAVVKLSGLP